MVMQHAAAQAALEFLLQTGRQPDVLHCHDWSTASLAQAYWCAPRHPRPTDVGFTRHALIPRSSWHTQGTLCFGDPVGQ